MVRFPLAAAQWSEEFREADLLGLLQQNLTVATDDEAQALLGRSVRIEGLKGKPELNGRQGTVKSYSSANERFGVVLGKGETVAVKRLNLRQIDGQQRSVGLVGEQSDQLDDINLRLLSGFSFIGKLARDERQLVLANSHDAIAWPREGMSAIARAAIRHYERGHLAEARDAFEAIEFACAQREDVFSAQEAEHWRALDALMPGMREEKMAQGTGADAVLGTCTTLRALSQAC